MAVIEGRPGSGKKPSFNKNVVVRVARGQLIAQSWPRKRGKPKSPVTREQNEWFRQANLLAKYADGQAQWMAIAIAKGSPWFPRDLLMSAMRGRLFEVLNIDGQEYRAMAVNEDVSSDLDFLAGTVPGTIIVRGPSLWQGLVPGAVGEALTSTGPETMPSWQPGPATLGQYRVATISNNAFTSSAFATKGYPFKAREAFTIQRLGMMINGTAGHTYRGHVIEIDDTEEIIALTATTADVPSVGTEFADYFAPLVAPAAIVSGNRYVICWSRNDGADTFALPLTTCPATLNMIGLPANGFAIVAGINAWARLAKAVPAIGDTFTVGSGVGFHQAADINL